MVQEMAMKMRMAIKEEDGGGNDLGIIMKLNIILYLGVSFVL